MYCGSNPNEDVSVFRCLTTTRTDPWAVLDDREVDRVQNYQSMYDYYLYQSKNFKTPMSDAFFSRKNLDNLRDGIYRRVLAATGEHVLVEFDRDMDIQRIASEVVGGNANMPWTTGELRILNEQFVGRVTGNMVDHVHNMWRLKRQWNKPTYQFLQPRPLGRYQTNDEMDSLRPEAYILSHPIARAEPAYLQALKNQGCRPGDMCVNYNDVGRFWL